MASFPDTSRRMFRGRAGPTDSNLNKYQARRRKQPKTPRPEKNNKYGDFDEPVAITAENITDDVGEAAAASGSDHEESEIENESEVGIVQESESSGINVIRTEQLQPMVPQYTSEESAAALEIKHLLRRIRNVSESITLSSTSISNPSTWKHNVLNAVLNAILEWRAICVHYPFLSTTMEESRDVVPSPILLHKEPSKMSFSLVQQAMQCGPLQGSNAGYFKRCGSVVAQCALEFLEQLPLDEQAHCLYWTEKQVNAVGKWNLAAQKAVANDKLPSKSQQKKQEGRKK